MRVVWNSARPLDSNPIQSSQPAQQDKLLNLDKSLFLPSLFGCFLLKVLSHSSSHYNALFTTWLFVVVVRQPMSFVSLVFHRMTKSSFSMGDSDELLEKINISLENNQFTSVINYLRAELVITTNFDKTRVEVLNFVVILGRLFVHSNKQMMILKPCYSANAWFIHKASHGIGHPSFPPPQSTSLPLFLFQHLALSAEMHADDRYEQSTFGRPVVYCSSVDTSIGDLGRKLWSRTTRSRDSSDSGIWPGIIGCRVGM